MTTRHGIFRHAFLLLAFAFGLGLAGCEGSDGAAGASGTNGADGTDGAAGQACWDLNNYGIGDPDEDINGDGVVDGIDQVSLRVRCVFTSAPVVVPMPLIVKFQTCLVLPALSLL